jgi:hypothetical protein
MAADDKGAPCPFCKTGRMFKRMETIAFRQRSDRGDVHCRVSIEVALCHQCGSRSLDPDADRMFEEAFQREYGRLPPAKT